MLTNRSACAGVVPGEAVCGRRSGLIRRRLRLRLQLQLQLHLHLQAQAGHGGVDDGIA